MDSTCIQIGRKFIGIEKNKEFFEMAVARIRKEIEKNHKFFIFKEIKFENFYLLFGNFML